MSINKENKIDPIKYFDENYFNIQEKQLKEFHLQSPTDGLTRFFSQLEDFVFGASFSEINGEPKVVLFYAEYKKEFKSIALPLPIERHRLANDVTTVLSQRVCELNLDKDFFNVYNTFQHFRQSILEHLGYFTFNPFTAPKGTLLATQKIIPIEKLNRIDVLKELYSNIGDNTISKKENKIYLLVDNRSGYIKIGKSINPRYREKTLQSQEPETFLIAYWAAPAEIEKVLHKKYSEYRKRGEWFKLTFKELDEIKAYMDNL